MRRPFLLARLVRTGLNRRGAESAEKRGTEKGEEGTVWMYGCVGVMSRASARMLICFRPLSHPPTLPFFLSAFSAPLRLSQAPSG